MFYALISGLIALTFLLTFSSPNKPPKWHKALCAIGFIVAIGWISTIADEVVGILRAFGAIVGVSEAILGVTVFAMVLSCPNQSHDRETHYQILWPM
jgi:solute carrier family 24 (sodium/potassium/calcium exchanger), member 6